MWRAGDPAGTAGGRDFCWGCPVTGGHSRNDLLCRVQPCTGAFGQPRSPGWGRVSPASAQRPAVRGNGSGGQGAGPGPAAEGAGSGWPPRSGPVSLCADWHRCRAVRVRGRPHRRGTALVVGGTRVSARTTSGRASCTSHQAVVGAAPGRAPQPGSRDDCMARELSGAKEAAGRTTVIAEGGCRSTGRLIPRRRAPGLSGFLDGWRREGARLGDFCAGASPSRAFAGRELRHAAGPMASETEMPDGHKRRWPADGARAPALVRRNAAACLSFPGRLSAPQEQAERLSAPPAKKQETLGQNLQHSEGRRNT